MITMPPVTCSHCHATYDRDEATNILTHPQPLCAAALTAQSGRRVS